MSKSFRKYRKVRKAARARWYVGPWWNGLFIILMPVVVYMMGFSRYPVAWVACALIVGALAYSSWREKRLEALFWERQKDLVAWFDEGRLFASNNASPEPFVIDLDEFSAVDALEERGVVVRLLADHSNGTRSIIDGFDDMEAFAREFRLNAPRVRFRRVRLGFPNKLKEV
ncbi:MAG: hypothetical protein KDI75_11175 [Xanthomonadales bacterium]|nr:hypothetical protein [Xanthomonadales bacterium]